MPISNMKRILLAAPLQDKERLLETLQRLGCVQVTGFDLPAEALSGLIRPQDAKRSAGLSDHHLTRLRSTISKIARYDTRKPSMFSPKPPARLEQLMVSPQSEAEHEALVQEAEALERRLAELRGQEARITAGLEALTPWLKLDLPLEMLRDTPALKQYIGTLPAAALLPLQEAWAGKAACIEDLGAVGDLVHFWAAVHISGAPAFTEALTQAGYTEATFAPAAGTFQAQHDALQKDLASLHLMRAEVEGKLEALVSILPQLKIYHDAVAAGRARMAADENLIQTRESFLLRGWLPEQLESSVVRTLAEDFPDCAVQTSQPEPDDVPPVLLHNPSVFAPFESVVTGFALPSPAGVDPTRVMMPFFACFFGMMVSDAGYGLMMALLVPLLIKIMKPSASGRKLFWIIGVGGLFTIFWGFIYNTWFGFNPMANPIMDPINRPMDVMMLGIALGALHLLAGVGMAAYIHIKRGEYIDVLYDQVSWLMILAGLGLLMMPAYEQVGQYLALAGAGIILLFSARNKTKNPVKRLLSGLGALYGITGWISDLLSYVRLFGMGLATGVIGLVINQLVGNIFASGPIGWVIGTVIFVGAHIFNAGINILGAYVHSSRLQYIEFFGKFYEEGGKPFKPLEQAPRYVRISDA